MAVISDYLAWRGDLTFDKAPFNEVDNYIIAKIGCPDYIGIVPEDENSVELGEAVNAYFSRDGITEKSLGLLASPEILKTLKKLPELPRYRHLRLSGFRRQTDPETVEQFSALTVQIPGGPHYVSFRGTDDSIVGWKENFMMAVRECVPAQEDALVYLRWAASVYPGELIAGGHSKGGNLAIFAASRAEEEIQNRITAVYSNDGPGFNPSFFQNGGFRRIIDRTHYIVPQHSLVGTLLLQPCDLEVVKCPKAGVGSHDGFNWEVTRDHFTEAAGLSRMSRAFNDALENTLHKMSPAETAEFIDQLFDVLCGRGADSLSDLTEQSFFETLSTLRSLRKETRIRAFLGELAETTLKALKEDVLPAGRKAPKG